MNTETPRIGVVRVISDDGTKAIAEIEWIIGLSTKQNHRREANITRRRQQYVRNGLLEETIEA